PFADNAAGHQGYAPSNSTDVYKWMDAIFPYVKSEQVFNCPSQTLPRNLSSVDYGKYQFRSPNNYGSYGINGSCYPAATNATQTPPVSVDRLADNSFIFAVNMSQVAVP